jgi:hypothetical protein
MEERRTDAIFIFVFHLELEIWPKTAQPIERDRGEKHSLAEEQMVSCICFCEWLSSFSLSIVFWLPFTIQIGQNIGQR